MIMRDVNLLVIPKVKVMARGCKGSSVHNVEIIDRKRLGRKMFTKEGSVHLFDKSCAEDHTQDSKSSSIGRFVLLEGGRLVPVEPGGMVEVALNELGAKIVKVEIPSGERVDQEK